MARIGPRRRQINEADLNAQSAFLDLSNSNCHSLSLLRRFTRLRSVTASNTLVADLKDVTPLPSLKSITLVDSPLSQRPFYRVSLLCALSPNLDIIDGVSVSPEERRQAGSLSSLAAPYLLKGFLISSVDPPVVSIGDETIALRRSDGAPCGWAELTPETQIVGKARPSAPSASKNFSISAAISFSERPGRRRGRM
jgi:hypothetical protein